MRTGHGCTLQAVCITLQAREGPPWPDWELDLRVLVSRADMMSRYNACLLVTLKSAVWRAGVLHCEAVGAATLPAAASTEGR